MTHIAQSALVLERERRVQRLLHVVDSTKPGSASAGEGRAESQPALSLARPISHLATKTVVGGVDRTRAFLAPGAALTKITLQLLDWTDRQVQRSIRHGSEVLRERLQITHRASAPIVATGDVDTRHVLHNKMMSLLGRAVEQSAHDSRLEFYGRIIEQLVADEARIVSALADGSTSPLINVHVGPPMRSSRRAVLENASLIGNTAGIALPTLAPAYVAHLLALGLVEVDDEDKTKTFEYEVLMNDRAVTRVIRDATTRALSARVERRALKLSSLGRDLWSATMISVPTDK